MGVRFIEGIYDGTAMGAAVMVDSVSGFAFGPVFESLDHAQAFRDYLPDDPRIYTDVQLNALYGHWVKEHKDAANAAEPEAVR